MLLYKEGGVTQLDLDLPLKDRQEKIIGQQQAQLAILLLLLETDKVSKSII